MHLGAGAGAADQEAALLRLAGEPERRFGCAGRDPGAGGGQAGQDGAAVGADQGLVACQRARDSAGPA